MTSLLPLLAFATGAFAQDPEAPPATPSQPPPAEEKPAPKPAEEKPAEASPAAKPAETALPAPRLPSPRIPGTAPTAPPSPPPSDPFAQSQDEQIAYEARLLFLDIMASDARSLAQRATFPFFLEDRRFDNEDDLFSEWLRNLRDKRTDLLTLHGIEVFTPQDMEKKYGKPPARLAALPLRGPRTMIAVGNLSGHPAIAVFKQVGADWKIAAYHD